MPSGDAAAVEGSWRTLVQRYEDEQWITKNEYPGDWALQWEAVATENRMRAERLRQHLKKIAHTAAEIIF